MQWGNPAALLLLLLLAVFQYKGCECATEFNLAYNEAGCPQSAVNPLVSGINSATTAVAEVNGVAADCFTTAYNYAVAITCSGSTYSVLVYSSATCTGTPTTSGPYTNDQCNNAALSIGPSNTASFFVNCFTSSSPTIYADHGFYATGSTCTSSFSSTSLVAEFSGVVASNPTPVCNTWGATYHGLTPVYKSYKVECSDDLLGFQLDVYESTDCSTTTAADHDILNAATGGCMCSTTTSTCFTVTCSSSSVAVGDPRFVGFRGQKFAVTGTPGYVYNLLSDATVQYNSRFIHFGRQAVTYVPSKGLDMRSNVTFIGEVGLKFVDSADTEHRFHLNIFHPSLPSFTRGLLLKSSDDNDNIDADELYHRHLDTNALQEIIRVADEELHALYLEFDGARHPLSLSLPTSPAHHSREPLFRSSLRLAACGGRCQMKVHNGTNLISVGGPDLPATFWFAIVISVHGELYINEKMEPHTHEMTFTNNVHGIVGYTFRSNANINNSSSNTVGDIQHSVSYEDLDDEYYLDMLEEKSSSHRHPHSRRRASQRPNKDDEWKFLEAAKYLEGELADYELDASHDVWTDGFTFNQYQLPN